MIYVEVSVLKKSTCQHTQFQKMFLNFNFQVTDPDVVLHNLLRNALLGVSSAPKKGTELVKVKHTFT